ncbi:MAG: response regulator [Xanthobacteraceae bacterium]
MKILVVDDHVLIREALRGVLRELDGAATILEASGGAAAMHLIEGHGDLGLVLLDLTLPDCDGFSLLAGIREYHPGVSIVVMSALQDRATRGDAQRPAAHLFRWRLYPAANPCARRADDKA